jgi:hypothetical protein
MVLAVVVYLLAGGPIVLSETPPLIVAAAIAGAVALIGTVLTTITSRANRKAAAIQAQNAERLDLINAGQGVLRGVVETLQAENVRQTARIAELEGLVKVGNARILELEGLVKVMRAELRDQLGGASGTV